ncbi:MAG: diguanylate cyclase, partial [Eubacteriales bacterium]|nr:diguanylate cyclase [Eubacteriales bacterium]
MEFRDAVKYLRNELGLTQMELANALHVTSTTIGRWERGLNLPNRAISATLLEFAYARSASKACTEMLKKTADAAARTKLPVSGDLLYAVEHTALRELIDEASFPLYVCDMETDELLYINGKAEEMAGAPLSALSERKCYKCLMHNDAPCSFCHKNELKANRLTNYEVVCRIDGIPYRVYAKRVKWNGRDAQARYFSPSDSSKQLRDIIENMNGGVTVITYDADGGVRHAYRNACYYAMFGYTKEQFADELKVPYAIVLPEDAAYVRSTMDAVRTTGQSTTFRYRAKKRDGSVVFISCSSSLASVEGFADKVLLSVMTDITATVHTEQQALVLGQRLGAIMDNINNGVAASILRDDGTVAYVFITDRYYEMLGFTREQYKREVADPFDLVFAPDREEVREKAAALKEAGESLSLTYRAIRRDGGMVHLSVDITMMSFLDVDKPVMLSVFTDITHVVEANARLEAQRDQINEMLNTTPSGLAVIEVDTRDMESLRTTYYNDRFFSFSGYTREEYDAILKKNELSFVFEEDAPLLRADTMKICAGEIGNAINSTVRCHTKDGGYRWLLLTGQLAERRGSVCVVKISMVDVTARKEAEDKQRISEEMLRIAAETDKRVLITYDVKANTCHVESRNLYSAKYGETLENIPESLIDTGVASPESIGDLCDLFTRIRAGEQSIRLSLSLRTGALEYQWFECNATTVMDADGKPYHAVLVFHNITEQRVKEAVYKKWRQSIAAKPPESYSMFRCNLSKQGGFDEQDGALLRIKFEQAMTFEENAKAYAGQFVHPDDQEAYMALLDADTLLAMFYRGEHAATLEYREIGEDGAPLWRLLTVEMVEYPDSTDVQAFLLFEDIDEKKKAQLKEIERAETDPLTGVLNRAAFAQKVDALLSCEPGAQHALLMMDMDGFKLLNDTFGHAAGDQALIDVAAVMRSLIRDGDLICRLGGDEFLVCLRGIPYDAVIGKKARQMCEQVRKAFSHNVQISASIGISVYPRDGRDFDALYHSADKALYRVKQTGKNNYAFFSANDQAQPAELPEAFAEPAAPQLKSAAKVKRRMLIVDDDNISRALLGNLFKDEYVIETAKNGTEALMRLRH